MQRTILFVVCIICIDRGFAAQIQKTKNATDWSAALTIANKTPEELAKDLESSDVKTRQKAANGLYMKQWGAKSAIPALIRALKDSDSTVRHRAASCFRFFGPPSDRIDDAVPILADLVLKDSDTSVRRASVFSLLQLTWLDQDKTTKVAPAMMAALSAKDKYVRLNAAAALAILEKGGEKPYQILEEYLGDEDTKLRNEIVYAMQYVGLPALPPPPILRRCLQNKSAIVRRTAGHCVRFVIVELRREKQDLPKDIASLLTTALSDHDVEVVTAALGALSEIGLPAVASIPRIVKCLKHRNSEVRNAAAGALGHFGPAAKLSVPALEEVVSDEDEAVRRNGLRSLGAIAGELAIPVLEKGLLDPNESVRRVVIETLGKMSDHPRSAVPVLIKALADNESVVRVMAVRELSSFGLAGEEAISPVMDRLHDSDRWVREAAAKALGSFGPAAKKAKAELINTLQRDDERIVRCRAAESLGRLCEDPKTVVPVLINALEDKDKGVRMWAAWSLGQFGPDAALAIGQLTEHLKDPDSTVRRRSAEALKRIKKS
jgi:HEAT repeat protein